MIKNRIFSTAAAGILLSSFSHCSTASNEAAASLATESAASSTSSINATASAPSNTSSAIVSSKHSSLAKKFLGVMTGVVVGTPVCMVRKPMDEDKYAISDLTGHSKKGRAVVPTAVLWAPFSAVQGVLEAPFFAFNNSLVNYDKPFSKEQFSLVNPAASIKKEEQLPKPAPHDVR
jgi:hypothetical protein